MTNKAFRSIHELRDVESLNLYKEYCRTMNEKEAFKKILAGTRDHARTPMQWTGGDFAGFSDQEPWIGTDNDCKICNAEEETADKNSVWNYYRALINIRKSHAALIYGDIEIVNKKTRDLFTYYRRSGDETFYIECNLSREAKKRKGALPCGERLVSNYPQASASHLKPYEAAVWKLL